MREAGLAPEARVQDCQKCGAAGSVEPALGGDWYCTVCKWVRAAERPGVVRTVDEAIAAVGADRG
jgi:ribosomal protein L37AE/L43A